VAHRYACGLDWTNLPRIKVSVERIAFEQLFRSWYALFLAKGTPSMMHYALQLIDKSSLVPPLGKTPFVWKQLSLGTLVTALVKRGRSPNDLLNWMVRVSQLRARKKSVQALLPDGSGDSSSPEK